MTATMNPSYNQQPPHPAHHPDQHFQNQYVAPPPIPQPPAQPTTNTTTPTNNDKQKQGDESEERPDISEIGWLFVQQYYIFLNNQPQKLHLFYNKDSTLCHGVEGESVPSFYGQNQILKRLKEHEFDDCKVMISNVDCQASAQGGIVIQVLGEMANKGGPSQKFVQTFFLAPQNRGYFVLNDIFRYLKEDVSDFDENEQQEVEAVQSTVNGTIKEPKVETNGKVQAQPEPEVEQTPIATPASVPIPIPALVPVPAPAAAPAPAVVSTTPARQAAPLEEKKVEEELKSAKSAREEIREPAPVKEAKTEEVKTVGSPPSEPAASPTSPAPAFPSRPVSWAAITKRAGPSTAATTNITTTTAAAVTAAPTTTSTAPSAPAATPKPASSHTPKSTTAITTTHANGTHKKPIVEYHSAYIKHVGNKVDEVLLKKLLDNIGVVTHFQVEKQKNCAFVDFVDAQTLKAALAVHELKVGDQVVLIEERKRGGAKNKQNSNNNNQKKQQNANGVKKGNFNKA